MLKLRQVYSIPRVYHELILRRVVTQASPIPRLRDVDRLCSRQGTKYLSTCFNNRTILGTSGKRG